MNTRSQNSSEAILDKNAFFNNPVLNSPYERPTKHWELINGQPTQKIIFSRRPADFITPIPKIRSQIKGPSAEQTTLDFDDLSSNVTKCF